MRTISDRIHAYQIRRAYRYTIYSNRRALVTKVTVRHAVNALLKMGFSREVIVGVLVDVSPETPNKRIVLTDERDVQNGELLIVVKEKDNE